MKTFLLLLSVFFLGAITMYFAKDTLQSKFEHHKDYVKEMSDDGFEMNSLTQRQSHLINSVLNNLNEQDEIENFINAVIYEWDTLIPTISVGGEKEDAGRETPIEEANKMHSEFNRKINKALRYKRGNMKIIRWDDHIRGWKVSSSKLIDLLFPNGCKECPKVNSDKVLIRLGIRPVDKEDTDVPSNVKFLQTLILTGLDKNDEEVYIERINASTGVRQQMAIEYVAPCKTCP